MAQRGKQVVRPLRVNTDLANELMPSEYAAYLKNVITNYNTGVGNSGQDHNVGLLTPCVSNVSVDFGGHMPSGTNICVGSRYDRRLNQFYWFNYNSAGNHTIWVYNGNDDTVQKILQSSLLNFSPRKLITAIDIVIADVSNAVNVQNLQRLLYWTDGNSEPKKINVDVALAGGYTGLDFLRTTDEYFLRVKYPPLDVLLTNTLANPDTAYLYNYVAEKQFQFRYRYYYQDGERSTWSAISSFYYTIIPEKNFVELSLDAGSSLVTFVELGVRLSNTDDWKSAITISYDLIISNTTYAYDNVTNIFIYKFFNNEQYGILDQNDTNRPYSLVPLKSFAQSYTEQNVLVDGNILEGFDNFDADQLALPDVDVNYALYSPLTLTLNGSIRWTIPAADPITIDVHLIDAETNIDSVVDTLTIDTIDPDPFIFSTVITTIDFGDQVYLDVDLPGSDSIDNNSSLAGVYTNITDSLFCGTGDFSVTKTSGSQTTNGTITFNNEVSDPCSDWSTVTSRHTCPNYAGAFKQLKQGGVYKIAIAGYDPALRQTWVQPLAAGNITIDAIQENNQFQTNEIEITWNDMVLPDWVKYIKVLRTKNLVIDRTFGTGYIQCSITFDSNTSTGGFLKYDGTSGDPATDVIKNIRFTLSKLIAFNTDNYENTTTTYTFTQGDRIQFIRNGEGTWYNIATYGLIDEPLATDPTETSVTFLCEYNPELATLADGAWVEIYTPAKKDQVELYYEVSNFIEMTGVKSNNKVSELTTTLNTFDTYPIFWNSPYVDTSVNATGTIPFEHHSIYTTKIVPSNGEDIGRINVINVSARQLWYPARLRWSFAYLPNTFVNGLSMNAEANVKDFNRAYGNIVQLFDNFYNLLILQEDNCFKSVLAKQLVTLADGSEQLVATNTFISNPIELSGDFGCQNSESFQEDNGRMWWTDTKRGALCECDWSSIKDISSEGSIKSYISRKLKYIYKYNQNEHTTQTCSYDLDSMPTIATTSTVRMFVDGVWETMVVGVQITTPTGLAALILAAGLGTFTVNGDLIEIVDADSVYGDLVVVNSSGASIFEASYVCNFDFFTVPAGYDPKNKMYLPTFFNMNNKGIYRWNFASGFDTGDDLTVSIVIDGVTESGTYDISDIDDIVTALEDLANNTDEFSVIENNTVIDTQSSSGSVYGTVIINGDSFAVVTTDTYYYINNEYDIEIERNETIGYSMIGGGANGWYGFTPEYYGFIDAQLEGISMVTFKKGLPYFHNLYTTTDYNEFYGTQTDQVITPVFNGLSPVTEKRWMTIGYNSKNKTSTNSGTKYEAYAVATSDFQTSNIPIAAFVFREGFYYGVFFRNTSTGSDIFSGQPLRGTWVKVTLVRDTDEDIQPLYNELSDIIVNFETSAVAVVGK